jgi:hypothetical protein
MFPSTRLSILSALSLLTLGSVPAASAGSPETDEFFFGVQHSEFHFAIDHSMTIEGVPARFFTSRQEDHLGIRVSGGRVWSLSKTVGLKGRLGMQIAKAGYWLNWEIPGLASLDPLESSLTVVSVDLGIGASLRWWRFEVGPFVEAPFGFQRFSAKIEDIEGTGDVTGAGYNEFFGLTTGAEGMLRIGKRTYITVGVRRTALRESEKSFDVDGLILDGEFSEPTLEYFAGISTRR